MLQNNELLINYLDKNLTPDETARVNALLLTDKQAATELAYLRMAVEAVELGAIRDQVMSIRKSFVSQATAAPEFSGAVVRSMYKTGLRIAAILILVLGVSVVYKYSTVNNDSVFAQQFTDYALSTSRGENPQDALEEAYRSKNWNGVTTLFNQESTKNNKSYFLAGVASMELKNYPEAVSRFEHVLAVNAKSGESYFQDEAQYYLALAYLKNQQTDKGIALLNQIRANKNHLYNPQALQISATDLKVIDLKK